MKWEDERDYSRGNFEISAYKIIDKYAMPTDDPDEFDEDDIKSWNENKWRFVNIIVVVSRLNIQLGAAVMECLQEGVDASGNILDPFECIEEFDLINEAIEDANKTLRMINGE